LGAVKGWSGNPPAEFVQVIIGCIRLKRGAWGAFAPHVFYIHGFFCKLFKIFAFFSIIPLALREEIGYNLKVYALKPFA
jgi:hypothetical protein